MLIFRIFSLARRYSHIWSSCVLNVQVYTFGPLLTAGWHLYLCSLLLLFYPSHIPSIFGWLPVFFDNIHFFKKLTLHLGKPTWPAGVLLMMTFKICKSTQFLIQQRIFTSMACAVQQVAFQRLLCNHAFSKLAFPPLPGLSVRWHLVLCSTVFYSS